MEISISGQEGTMGVSDLKDIINSLLAIYRESDIILMGIEVWG